MEMKLIETLYNRMMNSEWSFSSYTDLYEMSIIAVNHLRKQNAESMNDAPYLMITSDEFSEDENKYHQIVIAQLKSWYDLRIINNDKYSKLFVSNIYQIIDRHSMVHTNLDELHQITTSDMSLTSDNRVSLVVMENVFTYPISGIGYMVHDPSIILIVICDYNPWKQWFGVIYRIEKYILEQNTEKSGVVWKDVYKALDNVGSFYIGISNNM